ncbi:MarR family winged helix-turn-helix transcriptional regulator [Uliginosibacterium gangwonense]|uniref:MarR family winged helix-turn-helix transcriptional regulator n=1 Tax=Uliginosibacterium gangwonense TaxID=392736 RepID=UPI000525BFC4|nr:MarR family transcriptional regulator [Uliginosibacterium gangwonense]
MVDQNNSVRDQEMFAAIELFFYAFRAFTARPDEILAERGLARLHHRILYFVARRPGQRVSDLLATLGISKQAVHAPLRQLQDAGLVVVDIDAQDRRARCLSLTPEGAALEARLSQTQRQTLAQAFASQGEGAESAWRRVMEELAGQTRPKNV